MRAPHADSAFHDFGAYERLLIAAQEIDHRSYVIALLGGAAGLRAGEIVALEWDDVDLERRQIRVQHSDCSHLAMQGAPMRGVQELVGHQRLAMTQRYSHLSPATLDATIRLLEHRPTKAAVEDSLETAKGGSSGSVPVAASPEGRDAIT